MKHSFSYADGGNSVVVPKHDAEPVSVNDVSYVELLPQGWAWYRLSVVDDKQRELSLVEASDPAFVFETRRFSLDDANAEQHFSELGLFFVDAPPAETSKGERRAIAEALYELVTLSDEVRRTKEMEAQRLAGWQGVMRFFVGSGETEKKDIPAMERKILSLQERFMDLCRQANENREEAETERGVKPGARATGLVSLQESSPNLSSGGPMMNDAFPSQKHEEALRVIIGRVLEGIEDVSKVHENLRHLKVVTVEEVTRAPLDETVRRNVTALIEEARAKGIDVMPQATVESVFDALAAQGS